jgi:hypothetical protein
MLQRALRSNKTMSVGCASPSASLQRLLLGRPTNRADASVCALRCLRALRPLVRLPALSML